MIYQKTFPFIAFIIQIIGLLILCYYVSGAELVKFSKFLQTLLLIDLALLFNNKFSKVICLILLIILDFQLTNYMITGDFITPEAILNIKEASSVGFMTTVKLLLFFITILLFFLPNIIFSPAKKVNFLLIVFSILLIIPTKPIYQFIKTIHTVYEIRSFKPNIEFSEIFKKKSNIIGNSPIDGKNSNVILIFAEGFSDCAISKEVTPNLFKIRNKSLQIINYFNHTYPTYRGIRGSNISGYQLHELEWVTSMEKYYKDFNAVSLPTILKKFSYKSIFVSPHNKYGNFSKLLNLIGYDEIDGPEKADSQDDKTTFEHLFDIIDKQKKDNQKFIIATYLLGTHLGLDSPHQKYGNGKNIFLNKFYNQDYYFGKFVKKLEEKNYLTDTILVFTADHAAYPAPGFKAAFSSSCNEMVDKIPLIIYKKGIYPMIYDGKNRNSLSLAPTILDILKIYDQENYFLGNSLFCNEVSEFQYISTTGHRVFSTKTGVVESIIPNSNLKDKIIKFFKVFG